ncbi:MAG: thioesterase [Desulfuromonadaceae bacterium]|nr:thioesterase [Desulfuromonadaceae bacterium]MDD5106139.1 thioesterase [Desulfuromonadaceae bacterium]
MPEADLVHVVIRADGCLFEREFTVQPYEADQRNASRPVALLNYMQSAAGEHAALLGVSVADLRKSGHTWVLSRIHLAMDSYPRGGRSVRIKTWPAARENLFTIRDFTFYNMDGIRIGSATTSWAVLNLKTRRPVKLGAVLPDFPVHPERALVDPFTTIPELKQTDYELRLPVLRGDLDINRHVNNTVYAGWALETIPEEIDSSCRLASLEIAFRAEALYGDTIVARTAQTAEPHCYLHRIENERDGRELARIRTRWTP